MKSIKSKKLAEVEAYKSKGAVPRTQNNTAIILAMNILLKLQSMPTLGNANCKAKPLAVFK